MIIDSLAWFWIIVEQLWYKSYNGNINVYLYNLYQLSYSIGAESKPVKRNGYNYRMQKARAKRQTNPDEV